MPLLNIFGDLERFTTEQLYPLRYVITPLLVAAVLAGLYMAYRRGALLWMRRNPMLSAGLGVPVAVVLLIAGDYFLSPLWERSYLAEESPLAVAPVEAAAPAATPTVPPLAGIPGAPSPTVQPAQPTPAPSATGSEPTLGSAPTPGFQPGTVARGTFIGADDFHFGRGDALIIETAPGSYVLRLENFSVRNGPDLFVYLSEDPTGESVDEAFNLGSLKATDGAFNYEIPPGIDVSRVKSAVVWCRQFSTLFTHAELM